MKHVFRIAFSFLSTLLFLLPTTAVQAQNESSPPLPPPGKLVDVGGCRLHLNCTGEARAGQARFVESLFQIAA